MTADKVEASSSAVVADSVSSQPMRIGERWASALGLCIQRDGVVFDRARYAFLKTQLVFRMDVAAAGDADPLGVFSGGSRSVAATSRVVRGSIIDDSDASESEEDESEVGSDGHPASAAPGRSQPATGWAQFFSDETLLHDINTDLERLFPVGHEALFRRDDLRDVLRHVLFVWCKLHPDVSYRQGMHDVAAVVLYAFLERNETVDDSADSFARAATTGADDDDDEANAATYTLPAFAETDTFLVFEAIMLYLKPFYEVVQSLPAERQSNETLNNASSGLLSSVSSRSHEQRLFGSYRGKETNSMADLFGESAPPPPHSSPAPLATQKTARTALPALNRICHSIQYELLQQKDPQLFYHLQNLEIVPETYCLRWVRLLLAREFRFDELLQVWDAMIHDHERPDIVFPAVAKDEDYLHDLPRLESDGNTDAHWVGFPLLRYVCVAKLLAMSPQLRRSDNTGCWRLLMHSTVGDESENDDLRAQNEQLSASALIRAAQVLRDPTLAARDGPDGVDVVEFQAGSLGIILSVASAPFEHRLAVKAFIDDPPTGSGGVAGQAKASGRVHIGDILHSINGVPIVGVTTEEVKRHLQLIDRPMFMGFLHVPTSGDDDAATADGGRRLDNDPLSPPSAGKRESAKVGSSDFPTYSPEPVESGQALPTHFLPGEMCYAHVETSTQSFLLSHDGSCLSHYLSGKLYITNYRCFFTRLLGRGAIDWQVPVLAIASVDGMDNGSGSLSGAAMDHAQAVLGFASESDTFRVVIRCKDTQVVRLSFPNHAEYSRVYKCLSCLAFPASLLDAFCFAYAPTLAPSEEVPFDLRHEYERIGLLNVPDTLRCIDQSTRYDLCDTYPQHLIVPAAMTDVRIKAAAAFRSLNRLPVVSWRHRGNGATISRSSQPLVGLKSARSMDDELLVRLLCTNSTNSTSSYTSARYVIMDARSQLAAVGNKAMGKGTEVVSNYRGAKLVFLNIDNIHTIRQSFQSLTGIFEPRRGGNEDAASFYSKVESAGWLRHVRLVLKASAELAHSVHNGVSVLTHCSDGWDRTSQMVALAELMLDPFYRTLRGFQCLVEKDWCSFGHQFGARCGHARSDASNDQRSPVFLLWLDCVWQFIRQFPSECEFNEKLLLALADHVFSCKYGTFMFDSERQRCVLRSVDES